MNQDDLVRTLTECSDVFNASEMRRVADTLIHSLFPSHVTRSIVIPDLSSRAYFRPKSKRRLGTQILDAVTC